MNIVRCFRYFSSRWYLGRSNFFFKQSPKRYFTKRIWHPLNLRPWTLVNSWTRLIFSLGTMTEEWHPSLCVSLLTGCVSGLRDFRTHSCLFLHCKLLDPQFKRPRNCIKIEWREMVWYCLCNKTNFPYVTERSTLCSNRCRCKNSNSRRSWFKHVF